MTNTFVKYREKNGLLEKWNEKKTNKIQAQFLKSIGFSKYKQIQQIHFHMLCISLHAGDSV